jgi:hypothetical protein
MSKPLPLIDAMTGETVGYELRPGDDPIVIGTCAICAMAVWTGAGDVIYAHGDIAHPHCARYGMWP